MGTPSVGVNETINVGADQVIREIEVEDYSFGR